jgi:hypothetical protein
MQPGGRAVVTANAVQHLRAHVLGLVGGTMSTGTKTRAAELGLIKTGSLGQGEIMVQET